MSAGLPVASGGHEPGPAACANCGAPVVGPFCPQCGQRTDAHVHSLGHFVGEAAEVLTHADSSVWRTLLPLMLRPGFLTREFFAGRRARYLQPFRLYVIVGVVFFIVATLFGGGQQKVSEPTARVAAAGDAATGAAATGAAATGAAGAGNAARPGEPHYSCSDLRSPVARGSFLGRRITEACERINAGDSRALSEQVTHNIGRAMFVFLPVLAAFMKLLYWRPRRYFLEHLVLLLHNHAFIYLLLALFVVLERLFGSGGWSGLFAFAMCLYAVRYLYRSMRTVYAQGGLLTFLKFSVLAAAYVVAAGMMVALTALVSALFM